MAKVGKALNSKLGKIIMLAITIYTMGAALLAGGQGFMAGQGFIGKFVNGGKAFINSLAGTSFEVAGQTAEGAGAAAGALTEGAAAGEGAVQAGEVLAGADPTAIGGIAKAPVPEGATKALSGAPQPPSLTGVQVPPSAVPKVDPSQLTGVTLPSSAVPKGVAAASEQGWLTKAADAAKEFATSSSGATVIGGAMQGYGRAAEVQAFLDEQRRVGDQFADPNDPGMRALRERDYGIDVPRGLAAAPAQLARRQTRTENRGAPTVPFRRSSTGG